MIKKLFCFFVFVFPCLLEARGFSPVREERFWNQDPYCLEGICAYYSLYQDSLSEERLLGLFPQLSEKDLSAFVHSILSSKDPGYLFPEEEIAVMRKLSLPRVRLSCSWSGDPDLARELILAEFPGDEAKAQYYTTYLDILALRAYVERLRYLDRLTQPSQEEFYRYTIEALNKILFYEEGIRYPSKKEMFSDSFSFLSSVTDSKFGVCLGVVSLYFSLAQRLQVSLEAVTPPGHIYLRCFDGKVNIETTAGGRHIPTERYQDSLDTEQLRVREPKELIGLTFMNQGSFAMQKGRYADACQAYEKARLFLGDQELSDLFGMAKILNGDSRAGKILLESSPQSQVKGSLAYDYLHGYVQDSALMVLFMNPGSTYAEVIDYEKKLQGIIKSNPRCCECRLRLASVSLYLGKTAEGVSLLEECAEALPDDLALHMKLCKILCDRYDYVKAEKYFRQIKKLIQINGIDEAKNPLFMALQRRIAETAP